MRCFESPRNRRSTLLYELHFSCQGALKANKTRPTGGWHGNLALLRFGYLSVPAPSLSPSTASREPARSRSSREAYLVYIFQMSVSRASRGVIPRRPFPAPLLLSNDFIYYSSGPFLSRAISVLCFGIFRPSAGHALPIPILLGSVVPR